MTEEQLNELVAKTESDQVAASEFSQSLLKQWMRRNTLEGMNIKQSLWVFARFEKFTIEINGNDEHVDLFKMFASGAIPTLYYCLLQVQPDDMSETYHWLTEARINWVKSKLEEFLGPQVTAYIQAIT